MNTLSLAQSNVESARWLRFLSRWALATVVMALGLLAVYLGGIGFSPADNALGAEYSDLLQAVRAPNIYRLAMTFDAGGWLMMAGGVVTLAIILMRSAPIRAMLVAACGIGLVVGVIGGAVRLVGISDLAVHYSAASPAQQAALLPSALSLYEIFGTLFVVGDVLAAAAYLLLASVALAQAAFPRWLTGWFALAGVLALLQAITSAVGAFSFPILLLTVVVGILGLNAAIAVAFWRPAAEPAPAVSATVAS